ncbi:MAG: DUF308 domain-containing protein [Bacteroidetes bacterium]|nr:DUF308 domain-containing protein [Bacteroidota bacterium]
MLKEFTKNWWLMTLNGVIALIFGIFAIILPNSTIMTIAKYFGLIVLIAGVILLIGGIMNQRKGKPSTLLFTEAVISIVIGLIIMIFTKQTLMLFVILIGIWAIILGILQLTLFFSIKDELTGKTGLLINGLITLVFGILIFFNPFTAVKAFTVIVGIVALFFGAVLIFYSMKIKSIKE